MSTVKKKSSGSKKTGRPSKYDKSMCSKAISYMKEGNSVTELAAHLGVCTATIYVWESEHEEFLDALTRARELSQVYWERKLKEMMTDPNVNPSLVKLYFANRFKWCDRVETKNENNNNNKEVKKNYRLKSLSDFEDPEDD